MDKRIRVVGLLTAILIGSNMICHADSTPTPPSPSYQNGTPPVNQAAASFYDQGVTATKNNDFKGAFPLFEKALAADPNNPDILNMLAYTQRNLGLIDDSLANYKKALDLRPNFPQAREYLGEAYLQAALAQIDTLKGYGTTGKDESDKLTKSIKDAAAKL